MIKPKIIHLPLIAVFFLLVQSVVLNHQVEHIEEADHSGSCLVCLVDSSSASFLPPGVIHLPVFEKELLFQKSFACVKKHLPYQLLPRSPPNIMI